MAEFEQHLTNEQLSAMLDGQLSESEQEYASKHLPTCEQCQQRQAELRQMVTLLHALPQPALPRSFALPLDITVTEQTLTPIKESHRPLRSRPTTPFLPSYVYSTMRAISTIAAVIGIVFLLTSVLPLLFSESLMRTSASSTSSSTGGVATTRGGANAPQAPTPRDYSLTQEAMSPRTPQNGVALATPTAPPKVYAQARPGTISVDPAVSPVVSLFDLSTLQGRAILGCLLLVLGIIGLTIFRRRKHSIKTTTFP